MTEGVGLPLWLLAELTYRCPLQCPYCSNPLDYAQHKNELTTQEWFDVFDQARQMGAVQLGFSGGEPLVRQDLEQLVAQNGIITHTRNHRRHQLVDEFTGGGEAIHTDTTFGLLIENDVVQVIAIVPDAELRTHPIMTDRRAKHFRNQVRKRCHHTLQPYHFFG